MPTPITNNEEPAAVVRDGLRFVSTLKPLTHRKGSNDDILRAHDARV